MPLPRSLRLLLASLLGLLGLSVLLSLLAMWAAPGWVQTEGAARASQALGRQVSIAEVRLQPWRLGAVVRGVTVAGGTQPLFELAELDGALSLRSLLRGHLVVESLRLQAPQLNLARTGPGRYDIDDLIDRFSQPRRAPSEPLALAVYNLQISDGRLRFDDRPVQRVHELTALKLDLPFLSTLAADVKLQVQPHFSARLNGVALNGQADALPFAAAPQARLALKLAEFDLAPLAAYLPADLPVRLAGGRLDLDLALDFAQARPAPSVKLSGQVVLRDAALTTPAGAPLLAWQSLTLPLVDVQPLRRQLALGTVRWQAPRLSLTRDRAGHLNLPAGQGAPSEPGPAWALRLAGFQLADGQVALRDAAASPPADIAVDALQLSLGPAAWPLGEPWQLDASAQSAAARLQARATLSAEQLAAEAELSALALARLRPWLPQAVALSGDLAARAALTLPQPLAPDAASRAQLSLSEIDLRQFRLAPVLQVARARLDNLALQPAQRRLTAGQLRLEGARAQLVREADGQLNLARLLPPASAEPAGPPWQAQLAALQLDASGLTWRDTPRRAALALDAVQLQAEQLRWPATSAPLPTRLSLKLAALGANGQPLPGTAGSLRWQGGVGLAPLSAQGRLVADKLPLHLLDPYLDPAWGLHLQRAELGAGLDVSAREAEGGWAAEVQGDARLNALSLQQARMADGERVIGEDLLSWQALQLSGLSASLAPGAAPRIRLREAGLSDFYARLIVNEQGRLNLRDLGPANPGEPATPSAPGPGVQLAIDRTVVQRGRVDFSDRFIQPRYSAQLTDLTGSLGAFAAGQPALAPLTLRGKVAGTGLLEIDGEINPGGPLAMDVRAHASDIELAPLSPYAGKYAGYGIERGKLSTRLHYRVATGGALTASNQIILNQLTFGDRVDSAAATALPVRFAVSLLKDGNGVIDLNLPVSGSLNDPEFSVGGIVWKLILNLIGKALTSPFALFTGSDAPEAAQITFAPAGAQPQALGSLDRIARLLADRPGVQLTLTGWADPATEPTALREARLAAALAAENSTDRAASPDAALKRLYQGAKLADKPKNFLGLAKDIPAAEMRARLLASYAVDDDALRQLAVTRAVAVRDALLARGAPNARVFLAAPKLRPACTAACDQPWHPHVEMTLGSP